MKKLFYGCAAILCLVLVYHFGATNAQGQSNMAFQVVGPGPFVVSGNTLYVLNPNISQWMPLTGNEIPPVPVSEIVYYRSGMAVTASGEGWTTENGSGWRSIGLVPGSPTPATQSSWGQVKARYR